MSSQLGCQLLWHDMIEDIHEDGDLYTMLIAHEFFDALPFHLLEVSTLQCSRMAKVSR